MAVGESVGHFHRSSQRSGPEMSFSVTSLLVQAYGGSRGKDNLPTHHYTPLIHTVSLSVIISLRLW